MKKYNLLILFFCLFTANSFAQVAPPDSSILHINLDETVITANRDLMTKKRISQEIFSVNALEISRQNFQNTADLLSGSGALSVQKSQQGGGSTTIRGFEASRVLYVVDGVRMNNLIFRAGHLQNIITVDENSLEKVEVLYGAGSSVHGSDALGGVVYLQTLRPHFSANGEKIFDGNAFIRYGSANNEQKAHADFRYAEGKIASVTSFTYSKFGDMRMGKNTVLGNDFFGARPYYVERVEGVDKLVANDDSLVQKSSGYTQYDVLQKIAYKASDRFTHELNFQYSTSSNVPRYDRLTDASGSGLKYAEWYYGPQKRLLAGYTLTGNDVWGQDMKASVFYQNVEESRHQRKFGKTALQNRTENVQSWNINLDFSKKSEKSILHYGLETQLDELVSEANEQNISTGEQVPLDTRYPDGYNHMAHADIFGAYSHFFSEKLTMNLAARTGFSTLESKQESQTFFRLPYSTISQKNWTYSGNFGLAYLALPQLKLQCNLSSAYRVPNIDDLSKIFETVAGTLIVPNENLKPEKTVTADLGFTLWSDDNFLWENTAFYTFFYDAIVTSAFTYNGQSQVMYDGVLSDVVANQNEQKAYITGFSSRMKTRIDGDFWFNGSVAYTYGRITSTEKVVPLDHIPPVYGRLGVEYLGEKLFSEIYVNFNGKKDISDYHLGGEDNEQYAPAGGMPAWYTVNFKASYNVKKMIDLQLGIENIFDVQYRTFASGFNAAGRNVLASVRVHF